MIEEIAIIGNGRVGNYLAQAFSAEGLSVNHYARNPRSQSEQDLQNYQAQEDLCLLCVSDQAIATLSKQLPFGDTIVAHVSGATSLHSIDKHHPSRAIFYPLMSFSDAVKVELRAIPFCLEANNDQVLAQLTAFAKAQGLKSVTMNDTDRAHLHLAAVLAHNFSQHLFQKAYEILAQRGIDFQLMQGLLQQMTAAIDGRPPKEKQTGPAVRRDQVTIDKHLSLIDDPQLKGLYQHLTDSIIRSDETEL